MDNLISKRAAIDTLCDNCETINSSCAHYPCKRYLAIEQLPSAQSETCEGCKHFGKWENEVEYRYPSPCTCCKRRVEDHYER